MRNQEDSLLYPYVFPIRLLNMTINSEKLTVKLIPSLELWPIVSIKILTKMILYASMLAIHNSSFWMISSLKWKVGSLFNKNLSFSLRYIKSNRKLIWSTSRQMMNLRMIRILFPSMQGPSIIEKSKEF